MKAKKGDWAKATGGYEGIVFTGRRWETFKCVYCAFVDGLIEHGRSVQTANVWHNFMRIHRTRGYDHKCKGATHHRRYNEIHKPPLTRSQLDAKMRAALKSGKPATTKEFATQVGVSVDRANSSLARVIRQDRKKKKGQN